METLIKILQFLTGLCLVVTVHELGHFLAAKAFGIRVQRFYLFFDAFGISLFKKTINGTQFGIGWIPLGGYVRLAGASPDPENDKEPDRDKSGRFDSKPVWNRIVVMLSGVFMNLVLALLIYCGMSIFYGRHLLAETGTSLQVVPNELGLRAGLLPGDEVKAINADSLLYEDELTSTHILHGNTILSILRQKGKERVHMHIAVSPKIMQTVADEGVSQFFSVRAAYKVDSFYTNLDLRNKKSFKKANIVALNGDSVASYNDFLVRLKENKDRQLYLTVVRKGQTSILPAHRDKDGHIGFSLNSRLPSYQPVKPDLGVSLANGTTRFWTTISDNTRGLKEMVTGEVKVKDGLIGPLRFTTAFSEQFDWKRFWNLVALLSIGIALFNVLPLAPLDGGAVVILVWEAVKGKPVGFTASATFQTAGLSLMIVLALYVLYNDLYNLF